jgi:hypothetical protein
VAETGIAYLQEAVLSYMTGSEKIDTNSAGEHK